MSSIYESIMTGLTEAVEDAHSATRKLQSRTVVVVPVKEYQADQIKCIRSATNMSQKLFANYLGVSEKTVEAWEAGTNHPSGAASRLLSMMEMDCNLTKKYPFVKSVATQ
jgi:putative transcriptional regulator